MSAIDWIRVRVLTSVRHGLELCLDAIKFANPVPARIVVVLTLALWAIGLWTVAGKWAPYQSLAALRQSMPAEAWAGLFTVAALGMAWRLIDTRPRVALAIAINALACGLLGMCAYLKFSTGLLIQAAPDIGIAILQTWVTARTAWTALDQRRA